MKLYYNGKIIPFEYDSLSADIKFNDFDIDKSKFIKLMTDYEAYSIWSYSDGNIGYDDIPNITIETIESLEILRKTFDTGSSEFYDEELERNLISLLEKSFELLIRDFPNYTIWMF